MDLLEHPLEAVAFRLYSLPIPEAALAATGAAAAWTCLAAVLAAAAAAAAGIWRLRSSTTTSAVAVTTKPLELDPSPVAEVSPSRPSPSPAVASSTTTTTTTVPSSPKERYTAYYRDAGCCVGCCDLGSDEDGDGDENEEEEEHEEDGGDRDVLVSDGADTFGWQEVVRPLPLTLSPTVAAEMGTRRYRRSPTATALGGGISVVQLWDQAAGGGLTPTASPRRRSRVVSSF